MTRRILILGAAGFVGPHLRRALSGRFGPAARIIATSRVSDPGAGIVELDLTNAAALEEALTDLRPTHVINLAGIASPPAARLAPELAWSLHATAPEALGRLILRLVPEAWLFHVTTGMVYGRSALSGAALDEGTVLAPMDPYGVTKAAGDVAVGALANEGLRCIRLRPFNHIGPGQAEDFAVPAFAGQLARIARGAQEPVLRVGNLDAERDFLDVRDVVTAYAELIASSDKLVSGDAFNVASCRAVKIRAILERLIRISGLEVRVELDLERQRPSDVPRIRGSAAKLAGLTGWVPRLSLDQTLREIFEGFC